MTDYIDGAHQCRPGRRLPGDLLMDVGPDGRSSLDPDNVRGALVAHRVFEVSYRADAEIEIEAATEALIETLVGLRPLGEDPGVGDG